jgi:hypothetical protein
MLKADINISASGDNTIIAAPTSGFIAIDHINLIRLPLLMFNLKTAQLPMVVLIH